MVPKAKNFENISVDIYETGSLATFDERDPDKNLFDHITKSNFETWYFKPKEVKPYLRRTPYLEKRNVLHVNIQSIKRNIENIKILLEGQHVSDTHFILKTINLNVVQKHSDRCIDVPIPFLIMGLFKIIEFLVKHHFPIFHQFFYFPFSINFLINKICCNK